MAHILGLFDSALLLHTVVIRYWDLSDVPPERTVSLRNVRVFSVSACDLVDRTGVSVRLPSGNTSRVPLGI